MADNYIPTAPSAPKNTTVKSGTKSSGGGTRRPSSSKPSGGGGGGGGGGDPYAAAEARALARENDAKRRAANKYLTQASVLNEQIQALQKALGSGFHRALKQRLENSWRVAGQQDAFLMEGFNKRVGQLRGAGKDNEKAEAGQTYAALTNRGRERANAMSEAMLQGAGETDVLRAQQMSLRNWEANQSEVNRGFFDTLRSVNSSLNDLNIDTKTARLNVATEANADREQLWNQYYQQRSEAYTQLGNVYGQQAELFSLANEAVANAGTQQKTAAARRGMGGSFDAATAASSTAWRNPGVPAALRNWQGAKEIKGRQSSSVFANAAADSGPKRPEGATLREWSDDES